MLVENPLKSRWTLMTEGDRRCLPAIVSEAAPIDLLHYDSDKSREGRSFAWSVVAPHLSPDALVLFDDIQVDTDKNARALFDAWKAGRTGYPIVDAGMRQLAETGFMHNRVRMIVASFLVKDLHLPWQWGARWFLEQLVDGDIANNQHGWQWAAGSGTDAAPYFRVFNPTTQGDAPSQDRPPAGTGATTPPFSPAPPPTSSPSGSTK